MYYKISRWFINNKEMAFEMNDVSELDSYVRKYINTYTSYSGSNIKILEVVPINRASERLKFLIHVSIGSYNNMRGYGISLHMDQITEDEYCEMLLN